MAQPSGSNVRLSLFDRLTDEDPRTTTEAPRHEWDRMAAYKKSVARDLSHLLNTRINENDFAEEYPQARQSVIAFGVHDYTRSPAEQEEIRKSLERAIRLFEPRLTRVQVHFIGGSHMDLHFRISATLKADLGSEPVLFDAELPKQTRRFQVNEGR
jgi:type VI secretion system protein ImpF